MTPAPLGPPFECLQIVLSPLLQCYGFRPVKPKPTSSASDGNAWTRRGGGSAVAAAIKAALGRGADGDAAAKPEAKAAVDPPSQKPKAAEPVWVTPRMVARSSGSESAVSTTAATEKHETVEPIVKEERPPGGGPKVNGEHVTVGDLTADVEGKAETSRQHKEMSSAVERAASDQGQKGSDAAKAEPEKVAEPKEAKAGSSERTLVAEAGKADKPAAAEPAEPAGADKESLVQQFGKKKVSCEIEV